MFLSTCESDNLYEFFLVQKHILLNFLVNKSHHFIYTFYWSLGVEQVVLFFTCQNPI
jgi:hypothetical protein